MSQLSPKLLENILACEIAKHRDTQESKVGSSHTEWQREIVRKDALTMIGSGDEFVYSLNDQRQISIIEDFFALGSRVWDTAICVAKYFEREGDVWVGKRVLELGCGTGLLGMVVRCLGAECVVLTDQSILLSHLQRNVDHNEAVLGQTDGMSRGVFVKELDWGNTNHIQSIMEEFGHFDFVIGSDLSITVEGVTKLIQTLETIVDQDTRVVIGLVNEREGTPTFRDLSLRSFEVSCIGTEEMNPEFATNRITVFQLQKN